MTIQNQIKEIMKTSMKSGDKETLGFARSIHAAIRKVEVDERKELDEAEVQKVIEKMGKQRRESIEQFKKGGREDLVAQEEKELAFLQKFLPEQLGDDELQKIVAAAIAESQASSPKDMGQVMKIVVPQTQGRADGKKVSQIVRDLLQGK